MMSLPTFVITRNYKWTRDPCFFKLDVTAFLPGTVVADLFEDADDFAPRERR